MQVILVCRPFPFMKNKVGPCKLRGKIGEITWTQPHSQYVDVSMKWERNRKCPARSEQVLEFHKLRQRLSQAC